MNSKKWSLPTLNEFWRGLIYSVGATVISLIIVLIKAHGFNISWNDLAGVGSAGLITLLSYILLKIPQNSQQQLFKPEPPK